MALESELRVLGSRHLCAVAPLPKCIKARPFFHSTRFSPSFLLSTQKLISPSYARRVASSTQTLIPTTQPPSFISSATRKMPSTKSEIAKLLEPVPSVESLIAAGFNEELPNSQRTTLLPLDIGALEVMCQLYLPGARLERLSVKESFLDEPLGFQQVASFSCGTKFRPFQIAITQTTSHIDAINAMKVALFSMINQHDERDLEAVEDKKLGNFAVKSPDNKLVVWTRWTTTIQLNSPGKQL